MNKEQLKERTKRFALGIIELVEDLPKTRTADILSKQLLRSATSIGANYRSACHARSQPDFVSKISIVEEEADEALYWLELIYESGLSRNENILNLIQEANEITAIFTASGKTAKKRKQR